jgi:adenosylcobinamide kinase / adenosylcobinamide-phosphate guanylyltransferase
VSLIVLLGGARSGKSRLALDLAARWDGPVTFIATAEARDEEMAERIARHRAERPPGWTTVEEPLALGAALAGAPDDACVVVDCLALWLSNLFEQGCDPEECERAATATAATAAARTATSIVVGNEVGLGIVPATPLGRDYRDVLGRVNQVWVAAADAAALVVAGRALRLESSDWLQKATNGR